MKYTAEDVANFHRALHRLCGFPELIITMADQMNWESFLWQMEPLKDTADGAFSLADLTAVLTEMQRQKRDGVKWSLKPTNILRDPERFRDMVLTARSSSRVATRRAERPAPKPVVQRLADGTTRLTEDTEYEKESTTAREAALAELAEFRKRSGL